MGFLVVVVLIGVVVLAMSRLFASGVGRATRPAAAEDASAEARRWTDRLGAGVTYVNPGDNAAARQALADASERHGSAELAMASARTGTQFAMVTRTALEGLYYIRAARTALGLDPGPDLPKSTGEPEQTRVISAGGPGRPRPARPALPGRAAS